MGKAEKSEPDMPPNSEITELRSPLEVKEAHVSHSPWWQETRRPIALQTEGAETKLRKDVKSWICSELYLSFFLFKFCFEFCSNSFLIMIRTLFSYKNFKCTI